MKLPKTSMKCFLSLGSYKKSYICRMYFVRSIQMCETVIGMASLQSLLNNSSQSGKAFSLIRTQ